MKIKIQKKSIIQCFDTVAKAIPQKPLVPIWNNLLFVIVDQTCRIYAYNGKLQIRGQIAVESTDDVSMCIPANTLMQTLKLLNEEEIVFNYNPEKFILNVTAKKKKYKLTGFNPKDYPIISVDEEDSFTFTTQTNHIIEHIRTLSKIVDWNEMRELMSGITLLVNHGKLEITGVHGPKFFYRGITSIRPEEDFFVILHKDISQALGNAKGKGDTEMVIGKRKVSVKMDGFEYTSVLVDVKKPLIVENYFDYDSEKYIIIDKLDFLGAMRRLSLYSNDESALILSIEGDELKLSSENENYNIDAEEILDVKNKDVDNRIFAMSITYMTSMMSNIKGDKVKLFNGTGKIPMICLQDYEIKGESDMWGCGEFVIVNKTETV